MRNKQKYLAVLVLSWAVVAVLLLGAIREPARKAAATHDDLARTVNTGATVFAQYCVTCHGPVGEGQIGKPLNRPDLRGEPEKNKNTYDMILTTVRGGRPGTTNPHWVKVRVRDDQGNVVKDPSGQDQWAWASYTRMPAWAKENGGPLDEQQVQAVAYFIMMGDWGQVAQELPKVNPATPKPTDDPAKFRFADAAGLTPEENKQAQDLFTNKGCVGCHTIGNRGGKVGPDLSKVGAWGVDEAFLYSWIENPKAMSEAQKRAPIYWSNYNGPVITSPAGTAGGPTATGHELVDVPVAAPVNLPLTFMPTIQMTPEERQLLVRYLMGLK